MTGWLTACRAYMPEKNGPVVDGQWPTTYDPSYSAPARAALKRILEACLDFVRQPD